MPKPDGRDDTLADDTSADDTLAEDARDADADLDDVREQVYDASRTPNVGAWLDLDESERILLVCDYHARVGAELPAEEQRQAHAIAHAIAESQLAADDPPEVRQTLERLLRAGVGRHSAIHAIGNEILAQIHDLLQEQKELTPDRYERALRSIDPEDWIDDTAGLPDL